MAALVLVHGSWHNGTAWRELQAVLDGKDVVSYAPTLTGFDSLATPAGPDIGLHTHIRDIIGLIQSRSLDDVILVGHSYAGLVIAGVAEEIPDKVAALVFLDAFIPDDKQSLFDILGSVGGPMALTLPSHVTRQPPPERHGEQHDKQALYSLAAPLWTSCS